MWSTPSPGTFDPSSPARPEERQKYSRTKKLAVLYYFLPEYRCESWPPPEAESVPALRRCLQVNRVRDARPELPEESGEPVERGRCVSITQFEFTDRYGGNAPAWIRGCHGPCEAMGFYPTKDQSEWPAGTRAFGIPEEDGTPDDGWRFVKCPECNGAARVSWLTSIARIPRWLWRSGRFIFRATMDRDFDPNAPFLKRLKIAVWAGFWCDAVRIWREVTA
jgi:hypothetical protein